LSSRASEFNSSLPGPPEVFQASERNEVRVRQASDDVAWRLGEQLPCITCTSRVPTGNSSRPSFSFSLSLHSAVGRRPQEAIERASQWSWPKECIQRVRLPAEASYLFAMTGCVVLASLTDRGVLMYQARRLSRSTSLSYIYTGFAPAQCSLQMLYPILLDLRWLTDGRLCVPLTPLISLRCRHAVMIAFPRSVRPRWYRWRPSTPAPASNSRIPGVYVYDDRLPSHLSK
jgi:hypothetical protein